MKNKNATAVFYDSQEQAEQAVKILHKTSYGMKQFSILGTYYHTDENVVGYYKTENRMRKIRSIKAFCAGVWRFFFGSALL